MVVVVKSCRETIMQCGSNSGGLVMAGLGDEAMQSRSNGGENCKELHGNDNMMQM